MWIEETNLHIYTRTLRNGWESKFLFGAKKSEIHAQFFCNKPFPWTFCEEPSNVPLRVCLKVGLLTVPTLICLWSCSSVHLLMHYHLRFLNFWKIHQRPFNCLLWKRTTFWVNRVVWRQVEEFPESQNRQWRRRSQWQSSSASTWAAETFWVEELP